MAFNLSAVLSFATKGIKGGLGVANKSLVTFNHNMKVAKSQMGVMGPGLRNVGLMGSAVATGIGYAVNAHLEFQRAMDSVAAKMVDGKEHYQEMSDLAKEMGSTTIFTSKQAASGLEYLALAGFNARDAMGVLPTVLYTAGAGALDLGRASDIVTDSMSAMSPVMKVFGDKTAQAARMADMMALAQARTNTNIEQLGEAIKFGGGSLANMGVPLHQIIGSMGALANAGLKGSMGGTSLLNMMNKLSSPSAAAQNILAKMGITMNDLTEKTADGRRKLRSMSDVMNVFNKALEKNPNVLDKASEAAEIFGLRGQRAFFALANQGKESLDVLFNELDKSEGASKRMYDDMTNNLYGARESLRSAVQGSILNLGEMYAKMFDLKGVLQSITAPISSFSLALASVGKPMENMTVLQKKLMESRVGQFTIGLTNAFKAMRDAAGWLSDKMKSLFQAAERNGISFQKIGYYGTLLAGALMLVGPPLLAIGAALWILTPIVTAATAAVGLLGTMFALFFSWTALIIGGIALITYGLYTMMGGWDGTIAALTSFGKAFWEQVGPVFEDIKTFLMPTILRLQETFGGMFNDLFGNTAKAGTSLKGFGTGVGFLLKLVLWPLAKVLEYTVWLIGHLINSIGWLARKAAIPAIKGIFGLLGMKKEPMPQDATNVVQMTEWQKNNKKSLDQNMTIIDERKKQESEMSEAPIVRLDRNHLALTGQAAPNVNVAAPMVQTGETNIAFEVINTQNGESIETMIKRKERHQLNKQGDQVKAVASEARSQATFRR